MIPARIERDATFEAVQIRFGRIWPYAKKLFTPVVEREEGLRQKTVTEIPLEVDGYEASIFPILSWLKMQAHGSNIQTFLRFHPFFGRVEGVLVKEGNATAHIQAGKLKRSVDVPGGGFIETEFLDSMSMGLVDASRIKVSVGEPVASVSYRRNKVLELEKGEVNGNEQSRDYDRLKQMPGFFEGSLEKVTIFDREVGVKLHFSRVVHAELTKSGVLNFPVWTENKVST